MKKKLFILSSFLLIIISVGCSDEKQLYDWQSETDKTIASDPNSIIGTWELKTLCYPEGNHEIPIEDRDLFMFSSNGQVKVLIKKGDLCTQIYRMRMENTTIPMIRKNR